MYFKNLFVPIVLILSLIKYNAPEILFFLDSYRAVCIHALIFLISRFCPACIYMHSIKISSRTTNISNRVVIKGWSCSTQTYGNNHKIRVTDLEIWACSIAQDQSFLPPIQELVTSKQQKSFTLSININAFFVLLSILTWSFGW